MAEASSTLVACKLADPVNVKTRRPPRVPRLHKGDRRSVGTAWACTHVTSCCCRPPPSRADEEHHHLTIAQRLGGGGAHAAAQGGSHIRQRGMGRSRVDSASSRGRREEGTAAHQPTEERRGGDAMPQLCLPEDGFRGRGKDGPRQQNKTKRRAAMTPGHGGGLSGWLAGTGEHHGDELKYYLRLAGALSEWSVCTVCRYDSVSRDGG